MLRLDDVTLCCVDTTNHALALRALTISRRDISFARTVFLTDALSAGAGPPEGIDVSATARIESRAAYSAFVMKLLLPLVPPSYVFIVGWDRYVANPDAWDRAFLACDY